MASDRPISLVEAHCSIEATTALGKRVEIIGSTPSSRRGRPRPGFSRTKIDFFIFFVY